MFCYLEWLEIEIQRPLAGYSQTLPQSFQFEIQNTIQSDGSATIHRNSYTKVFVYVLNLVREFNGCACMSLREWLMCHW